MSFYQSKSEHEFIYIMTKSSAYSGPSVIRQVRRGAFYRKIRKCPSKLTSASCRLFLIHVLFPYQGVQRGTKKEITKFLSEGGGEGRREVG